MRSSSPKEVGHKMVRGIGRQPSHIRVVITWPLLLLLLHRRAWRLHTLGCCLLQRQLDLQLLALQELAVHLQKVGGSLAWAAPAGSGSIRDLLCRAEPRPASPSSPQNS